MIIWVMAAFHEATRGEWFHSSPIPSYQVQVVLFFKFMDDMIP